MFLDSDNIVSLTMSVVGIVVALALAVALVRAVREQSREDRRRRERPLPTPPPAQRAAPPRRPLDGEQGAKPNVDVRARRVETSAAGPGRRRR